MSASLTTSKPVNPLEHPGKVLYWRETDGFVGGGGACFAGEILCKSGNGFTIRVDGLKVKYDGQDWKDLPKNSKNWVSDDRRFFLSESQIPKERRE